MTTVTVKNGMFRTTPIINQTFTLLKGYTTGATSGRGFITVDGADLNGRPAARIFIESANDFEVNHNGGEMAITVANAAAHSSLGEYGVEESDDAVLTRINTRFDALNKFTRAARAGAVKSLIVSGAAGIGKTYGVSKTLGESHSDNYQFVSGGISPIGLYTVLYNNSERGKVVVFDDCDDVFEEQESLNLLKPALDTGDKRIISWIANSNYLRKEGIPNQFEFKGSVIFISNLNFAKMRGDKKQAHILALLSRSFFLDLTIHTAREKMLRINDLVMNHDMLGSFNLSEMRKAEVMDFIQEYAAKFDELSLRTVIKAAEIASYFGSDGSTEWMELASLSMTSLTR